MLPFLDAPQQKRLERSLRGYFKRGELVPAEPRHIVAPP
jgi:hypothetical protein